MPGLRPSPSIFRSVCGNILKTKIISGGLSSGNYVIKAGEGMSRKVAEINLEYNLPTVEAALQRMKNSLTTSKGQGYKAVILIHGYGSSGTGGSIRIAVRKALQESSLRGIVRQYAGGEQWTGKKRELLSYCKDLELYERRIAGNQGVTVVILK